MAISDEQNRAISRYEPLAAEGFTFYPITVEEYDLFLIGRSGLEVMQQSLPAEYLSLPFLSALYKLDYNAIKEGKSSTGLFSRVLVFLALALRLGYGKPIEERQSLFKIAANPKDLSELKAVKFVIDGEEREITPLMFHRLRPILAAQNGIELYSESANPELIEAEQELAARNSEQLKIEVRSLISTVASLSHTDEREIYGWAIVKLLDRQRVYQRLLGYVLCGLAETQGASWKGGNPYPNPFYDKISDKSSAVLSLQEFAGGNGIKAIQNAGGIEGNPAAEN